MGLPSLAAGAYSMKAMKIGEVARLSGTGIETIRFYEREGLLPVPQRRPSGYRQYDGSTVERLDYIRRAKELGFTLAEIRDLLELSTAATDCEHVRGRAEAKIVDIEAKIHALRRMKRALGRVVERCRAKGSTDNCPLVHKTRKRAAE
ncbi:MerR family transcriptional regulator [Gemmata sp.]|uniref:MerR family transcriptional regulator n=1 Tax=Gemmata sp. TaxID=1914242 RepID=UPI003F6ED803